MRLQPFDLRRRLYIIFKGEEGLDYGGVARSVTLCLSVSAPLSVSLLVPSLSTPPPPPPGVSHTVFPPPPHLPPPQSVCPTLSATPPPICFSAPPPSNLSVLNPPIYLCLSFTVSFPVASVCSPDKKSALLEMLSHFWLAGTSSTAGSAGEKSNAALSQKCVAKQPALIVVKYFPALEVWTCAKLFMLYGNWCRNADWAGTEKGQKHGVSAFSVLFLMHSVAYQMLFYLRILGKFLFDVDWFGL